MRDVAPIALRLLLIFAVGSSLAFGRTCPKGCSCFQSTVRCDGMRFVSMPRVENDTTTLYVSPFFAFIDATNARARARERENARASLPQPPSNIRMFQIRMGACLSILQQGRGVRVVLSSTRGLFVFLNCAFCDRASRSSRLFWGGGAPPHLKTSSRRDLRDNRIVSIPSGYFRGFYRLHTL